MSEPLTLLTVDRLRRTLVTVLDLAEPAFASRYRLVGTGAALLHGVDLPAHDVDILVRERGDLDALAHSLAHYPCLEEPEWLGPSRQYYANYGIMGVEVGISTVEIDTDSDAVETYGPGPWTHYVDLPCGQYLVPTVALELRLITEIARQRPQCSEPILSFLAERQCDVDLVRRGLVRIGLAVDELEAILNRLTRR